MIAVAEREVVTTWFGAFLLDGGSVVAKVVAPHDPDALADRLAARRDGRLTDDERRLIETASDGELVSRDRRLSAHGVRYEPTAHGVVEPEAHGFDPRELRELLARDADRALARSWDPSIYVEEAVRALETLDRTRNLLGERLDSWRSRDPPRAGPESTGPEPPTPDPELVAARAELEELKRSVDRARRSFEERLQTAVPRRTPNLSALLGAELAARLVAKAGGLERLARLPASTVQVLGAERAFFEHLRGRAPPPRHGLLFLHPRLQSAGRVERGRLARALAAKASIAARLDAAGAPLDPTIAAAFRARADELGRRGSARARRRRG